LEFNSLLAGYEINTVNRDGFENDLRVHDNAELGESNPVCGKKKKFCQLLL